MRSISKIFQALKPLAAITRIKATNGTHRIAETMRVTGKAARYLGQGISQTEAEKSANNTKLNAHKLAGRAGFESGMTMGLVIMASIVGVLTTKAVVIKTLGVGLVAAFAVMGIALVAASFTGKIGIRLAQFKRAYKGAKIGYRQGKKQSKENTRTYRNSRAEALTKDGIPIKNYQKSHTKSKIAKKIRPNKTKKKAAKKELRNTILIKLENSEIISSLISKVHAHPKWASAKQTVSDDDLKFLMQQQLSKYAFKLQKQMASIDDVVNHLSHEKTQALLVDMLVQNQLPKFNKNADREHMETETTWTARRLGRERQKHIEKLAANRETELVQCDPKHDDSQKKDKTATNTTDTAQQLELMKTLVALNQDQLDALQNLKDHSSQHSRRPAIPKAPAFYSVPVTKLPRHM